MTAQPSDTKQVARDAARTQALAILGRMSKHDFSNEYSAALLDELIDSYTAFADSQVREARLAEANEFMQKYKGFLPKKSLIEIAERIAALEAR